MIRFNLELLDLNRFRKNANRNSLEAIGKDRLEIVVNNYFAYERKI